MGRLPPLEPPPPLLDAGWPGPRSFWAPLFFLFFLGAESERSAVLVAAVASSLWGAAGWPSQPRNPLPVPARKGSGSRVHRGFADWNHIITVNDSYW